MKRYHPLTHTIGHSMDTMIKRIQHHDKDNNTNRLHQQEFDYLADMIHQKLIDLGYETEGSFSFDLNVSFDEEETTS